MLCRPVFDHVQVSFIVLLIQGGGGGGWLFTVALVEIVSLTQNSFHPKYQNMHIRSFLCISHPVLGTLRRERLEILLFDANEERGNETSDAPPIGRASIPLSSLSDGDSVVAVLTCVH